MSGLHYCIAYKNIPATDLIVLHQLMVLQMPHVDFVAYDDADGETSYDLVIDNDFVKGVQSRRAGAMIDMIERDLFKASYQDDVSYGAYHLNRPAMILTIDGQKGIELTDREVDIIAMLLIAGDKGVTKDDLLARVWGYRPDLETHTLETHIYRLRQKIEDMPDMPSRLVTIDQGYVLK